MDNWFTIEQIDRDTFSISEYKHWEETQIGRASCRERV